MDLAVVIGTSVEALVTGAFGVVVAGAIVLGVANATLVER